REPVRIRAQTVLDRLVLRERVVDERSRAEARLKRRRDRLGGYATRLPRRVLKAAERDVECQLAVVELDPERGDELAEQAVPGTVGGDRPLGEDLLLGLREQVRPVAAHAAEIVAAEVQAGS